MLLNRKNNVITFTMGKLFILHFGF